MKRYFQILLGGGMLSLLAVQSQGAVAIGNSQGNSQDQHFTVHHWANSQQSGGQTLVFDRGSFTVDPGVNDIFSVTRAANQQAGTLKVVDLGHNTDTYSILDVGGNVLATGTAPVNPNQFQNVLSPNLALASGFSTTTLNGIGVGTTEYKVLANPTLATQGIVALNFSAPVPEPSVSLLSMLGLAGLVLRRRRS